LINRNFILYSDYKALKSLNSQRKIRTDMMVRWITFLRKFGFSMKHIARVHNKVAGVLSRRDALLITFRS
jgi:hypothetical protein